MAESPRQMPFSHPPCLRAGPVVLFLLTVLSATALPVVPTLTGSAQGPGACAPSFNAAYAAGGANPSNPGSATHAASATLGSNQTSREVANMPLSETSESAATAVRPAHHVEGGGFTNPGYGAHTNPSAGVALPFFARRIAGTFSLPVGLAPPRIGDSRRILDARLSAGADTVTWIGHSTLLVRLGDVTFLTDPVWADAAGPIGLGPKRLVEPGLSLEELPHVDFAVISHNHYDHMDLETLDRLGAAGVRIFVPLANRSILPRKARAVTTELDWWQSERVGDATIHCVPARHWSRRGLFDLNDALWSGWVIESGDKRFYFAGDTGMFDGFATIAERLGPPQLAAIPIGAYLPREMMAPAHLDPDEAMMAVEHMAATRSLAVHHGTFVLSDEPVDEPARRYIDASKRSGRGEELDWVLAIGETREW